MRVWCTRCSAEVDTVVLEAAGVLAQVDHVTIQRWLETEQLHAAQMRDGSARICLDSLLRSASPTLLSNRKHVFRLVRKKAVIENFSRREKDNAT
jgi:hypothetical protein